MLIVPEQSTILILPPRTGSSSLHNAIREACPSAFMLYRHAEADAIPDGFDAYRVMGFVRHPLARMWSLFKFCSALEPLESASWAREEVMRVLESVQGRSFEDWLLNNTELFLPRDSGRPGLYQRHYVPETRKSQAIYLRPEDGTTILHFSQLAAIMSDWGLPAMHLNESAVATMPEMTPAIRDHLEQYMGWELSLGLELV